MFIHSSLNSYINSFFKRRGGRECCSAVSSICRKVVNNERDTDNSTQSYQITHTRTSIHLYNSHILMLIYISRTEEQSKQKLPSANDDLLFICLCCAAPELPLNFLVSRARGSPEMWWSGGRPPLSGSKVSREFCTILDCVANCQMHYFICWLF